MRTNRRKMMNSKVDLKVEYVSELDNIEEVLTYDYKSGYPEKLKMEV